MHDDAVGCVHGGRCPERCVSQGMQNNRKPPCRNFHVVPWIASIGLSPTRDDVSVLLHVLRPQPLERSEWQSVQKKHRASCHLTAEMPLAWRAGCEWPSVQAERAALQFTALWKSGRPSPLPLKPYLLPNCWPSHAGLPDVPCPCRLLRAPSPLACCLRFAFQIS